MGFPFIDFYNRRRALLSLANDEPATSLMSLPSEMEREYIISRPLRSYRFEGEKVQPQEKCNLKVVYYATTAFNLEAFFTRLASAGDKMLSPSSFH